MTDTMTAHQYQARMTEKQWRDLVTATALAHGWRILFQLPDKAYVLLADEVRRNPKQGTLLPPDGWPDLVIARDNPNGTASILFLELKTDKGKASSAQLATIDQLVRGGMSAGLVRPRDFDGLQVLLR